MKKNNLLPAIQSKLPEVGTTIFTVMSSLAVEHKAINLGQGFPDYPMNHELTDLVNTAMKDNHNQYVHMCGLPALREQIAHKCNELYGCNINPETEITVTPGGTYAIYTALTAVLQPGDEVILFEPAYDSYIPNIKVNGAIPVPIKLSFPDYRIPWDEVREKINARTRMIMINTPHNPTGTVLSREDLQTLDQITADTGIFILSDEVYEHLIYDGKSHESILRYPSLLKRSFVCFSFGKVYNCTGWKLGYCIAPEALSKEFRKIHQFNCFSCNSPVQFALAEFLKRRDEYLKLSGELQHKRDFLQEAMKQTRFEPIPSYGSYFQIYSYKNISEESEKDFAIRLVKEAGVATIPVSVFYQKETDNQVLRFCFSKKEETLLSAAERLAKF